MAFGMSAFHHSITNISGNISVISPSPIFMCDFRPIKMGLPQSQSHPFRYSSSRSRVGAQRLRMAVGVCSGWTGTYSSGLGSSEEHWWLKKDACSSKQRRGRRGVGVGKEVVEVSAEAVRRRGQHTQVNSGTCQRIRGEEKKDAPLAHPSQLSQQIVHRPLHPSEPSTSGKVELLPVLDAAPTQGVMFWADPHSLKPGSEADVWYEGIAAKDKDTWAKVEAVFTLKWPKPRTVAKPKDEAIEQLRVNILTSDMLGRQFEDEDGTTVQAHVVWAQCGCQLIVKTGGDCDMLLLSSVRATIPLALHRQLNDSTLTSWELYFTAVESLTSNQVKDAAEEQVSFDAMQNSPSRFANTFGTSLSFTSPPRSQTRTPRNLFPSA
ncbi:hypothetical protein C8F01DRAFT_1271645 [Mycena amicta]|nr:hypothetical protein C8F01DRAFT_1271645 [Mycena amicta]